jgi:(p)ppGpp synthase/HD superfamily hydrolase
MPTVEETLAFVQKAHNEYCRAHPGVPQVDKGGHPYWKHPYAVMVRLGPDADENDKLVALLHDVLEDTLFTADDLLAMGYSSFVVECVQALSRPEGVTYMNWIRSIAESGNLTVIRVKVADNEENSDPARIAQLPEEQQGIAGRYHRSLAILRPALAELVEARRFQP